jgi:hypothetical protein
MLKTICNGLKITQDRPRLSIRPAILLAAVRRLKHSLLEMAGQCDCCKNFDSNAPVYSSQWKTGRVFQDQYSIHVSNVMRKSSAGCLICSFLLSILDAFIPDWQSKQDKLDLSILAPDSRPFEVCVSEVPEERDESLRELVNVQLSNASSISTQVALKHDACN